MVPHLDLGFPLCFIWQKYSGVEKKVAGGRIPHLWLRWGAENLFSLLVIRNQLWRGPRVVLDILSSQVRSSSLLIRVYVSHHHENKGPPAFCIPLLDVHGLHRIQSRWIYIHMFYSHSRIRLDIALNEWVWSNETQYRRPPLAWIHGKPLKVVSNKDVPQFQKNQFKSNRIHSGNIFKTHQFGTSDIPLESH